MKIVPIIKQIEIVAPADKVWRALFNNELNRQWLSIFSVGTYAETDWSTGSNVLFVDGANDGIIGHIVTNNPHTELVIEYDGFIYKGMQDVSSEQAQAYKGSREAYKLTDKGGSTVLDISAAMGEDYLEPMLVAWDEALAKIKSLAEGLN